MPQFNLFVFTILIRGATTEEEMGAQGMMSWQQRSGEHKTEENGGQEFHQCSSLNLK